ALAELEDRPLLAVEVRAGEHGGTLLRTAAREARILGARLVVSGSLGEASTADWAATAGVPLVLVLGEDTPIPDPLFDRPLHPLRLAIPPTAERVVLFAKAVGRRSDDPEVLR